MIHFGKLKAFLETASSLCSAAQRSQTEGKIYHSKEGEQRDTDRNLSLYSFTVTGSPRLMSTLGTGKFILKRDIA